MPSYERDRFGQRPLYYAARDGRLHVAQRVDRLLSEASRPRAVDAGAAALALCGALPAELSLFRGVFRVPPGHVVRPGEGAVVIEKAPARDRPRPSGLLEALREAVAETREAAACALSGGLDSGLLLALLSEAGESVRCYTLASEWSDAAELRAAELLAQRFGAVHVMLRVPERSLPEHVIDSVRACEEPIWNGAAVARQLFFRQLRQAGESALVSGVGADELLCGNPQAMRAWPGRRVAERQLALELLRPSARERLVMPADSSDDLELLRRGHVETLLPGSTLPPECRTSASEGIQARLPYLQPSFADFALALPASCCVRDGVGKWPLREAARGLLPEEVRAAPKTARLAPSGGQGASARARWLELYADWLTPERLAPLECVDAGRARALLDRFAAGGAADPSRATEDAVLLRLVSLAMLAAPA